MYRFTIAIVCLLVASVNCSANDIVSEARLLASEDKTVADGIVADNVVVVLDDSGSMDERMRSDRSITKMDAAKSAIVKVLEQLPKDAHVGVILLNGGELIPLGPINKKAMNLVSGVYANGGTPLGERIKDGADVLLTKREKSHYGSYRLLVVTDGEANDPGLIRSYLPDILSRGLTVDVIGVDMNQDHSLATQVHKYRRADDLASLESAIKETFAETSADDSTAAEDYELAAVFPDGMACKAIDSLTSSGNHPIGEIPQIVISEEGEIAMDEDGNPMIVEQGTSGLAIFFGILVISIIAAIVICVAIKFMSDCC